MSPLFLKCQFIFYFFISSLALIGCDGFGSGSDAKLSSLVSTQNIIPVVEVHVIGRSRMEVTVQLNESINGELLPLKLQEDERLEIGSGPFSTQPLAVASTQSWIYSATLIYDALSNGYLWDAGAQLYVQFFRKDLSIETISLTMPNLPIHVSPSPFQYDGTTLSSIDTFTHVQADEAASQTSALTVAWQNNQPASMMRVSVTTGVSDFISDTPPCVLISNGEHLAEADVFLELGLINTSNQSVGVPGLFSALESMQFVNNNSVRCLLGARLDQRNRYDLSNTSFSQSSDGYIEILRSTLNFFRVDPQT